MKRFAYIILAAISTIVSCSTHDHEAILEQLRDHEERIQKLESICNKLNSNVEAVQTILTALEQNDYVTDIVKVMEDGIEVGYSITFAKGGTVTIYHGSDGTDGTDGSDGADGKDGVAPRISVRKASDGVYYWTADDEWLTDENGNMIPVSASGNPDSPDTGYITPQFRVTDGKWYVSYDDGNSWQVVAQEEEDITAPLFLDVSYDDNYVYITLADETTISIPLNDPYAISCTMSPFIEPGPINSNGDFGKKDWKLAYYRTPRFLKNTSGQIGITVLDDCYVYVFQYDESFRFISNLDWTSLKTETRKNFTLDPDCRYIRLLFRKNSSVPDFPMPRVKVDNVYPDEFHVPRSTDNGYQLLAIPVNITESNAIEGDGWELQGTSTIMTDYGLLALPETYSNIGRPTRLIIYCHGAAVHYTASSTRFPKGDIEPEYWLKEGYAVMDMDGNPFDDTNPHLGIPIATTIYEKAYNWIINTYNICKDGVFLGGRSMGGTMTFELLQSNIPVLAACPVVPSCNTLWGWSYMTSSRRKFAAEKLGFTGTPPTWTNGKKLSDEEYQYLYDNFDKVLINSPEWRGIENLPDKDVLFGVGHLSANTKFNEAEDALYSTLRYKTTAPVKIFGCHEDSTVPSRRNAELMYRMLVNAGQVCELRMFHSDASQTHHFELEDSRYLIDVTTVYGETIQAPLVYVEMLEFWRRYEPLP